jgi:hypothetical protein
MSNFLENIDIIKEMAKNILSNTTQEERDQYTLFSKELERIVKTFEEKIKDTTE